MSKAFSQCLPHQAAGRGSLPPGSGPASSKVLGWVSQSVWGRGGDRKRWSDSCRADVTFIHTFKNWCARHWRRDGAVEPGRCGSHVGLCAKNHRYGMLLLLLPPDWVSLSLPLPCPQCALWNRKGRRMTPLRVRRPWLRAGLLSAAAASWRTWNEQPRPKCSLQARCFLSPE